MASESYKKGAVHINDVCPMTKDSPCSENAGNLKMTKYRLNAMQLATLAEQRWLLLK